MCAQGVCKRAYYCHTVSQLPLVCTNSPMSSPQTQGFAARCRFHGLIWTLRVPPGIIKHIMQQALVLRLWQNGLSVKGNRECARKTGICCNSGACAHVSVLHQGFFPQPFKPLSWVQPSDAGPVERIHQEN